MRAKFLKAVKNKVDAKAKLLLSGNYIPLKAKLSPLDLVSHDLEATVDSFIGNEDKSAASVFLLQGDSGSGKTTFSLKLLDKLLTRATASPEAEIPVLVDRVDLKRGIRDWLNVTLVEDYKLSNIECRELRGTSRLIIVVDGFDELVHFDAENKLALVNLAEVGRLEDLEDGEHRTKLLITCRTHFLRDKASYSGVFGTRAKDAETYYLASFDETQIDEYLEHHIKDFLEEQKKLYRSWFREIPGLNELAANPLLLAMSLVIFPELRDKRASLKTIADRLSPIKRVEIFELYARKWFAREDERFDRIAGGAGSDLVRESADLRFREYIRRLAWEMVLRQSTQVEYLACDASEPGAKCGPDQGVWEKFLSDKKEVFGSRMSALIHRIGDGLYEFLHLDFRDFFSAEYLEIELDLVKADRPKYSIAHPFNTVFLTNQAQSVLRFMAERISPDGSRIAENLLGIVKSSITEESYRIAASNALSLLNYGGLSFSGMNLSKIKAPFADLTGAILYETNLSDADLSGCTFDSANMYGAKLTSANLLNHRLVSQRFYTSSKGLLFGIDIDASRKKLVVFGCCTSPIEIINLADRTHEHPFGISDDLVYLRKLKLSPDGIWLAIATKPLLNEVYQYFSDEVDLRLNVHNPKLPLRIAHRSSRKIYKISGHEGEVLDLLFVGDKLLTLGNDGGMRLWDMKPPFRSKLVERKVNWNQIKCYVQSYCGAQSAEGALGLYILSSDRDKEFSFDGSTFPLFLPQHNLPDIPSVEAYDLGPNINIILLTRAHEVYILARNSDKWILTNILSSVPVLKFNPTQIRWINPEKSFLLAGHKKWQLVSQHPQRILSEGEWMEPVSDFVYLAEEEALYAASIGSSVLKMELKVSPCSAHKSQFSLDGITDLALDNSSALIIARDKEGLIYIVDKRNGQFLASVAGPIPGNSDRFWVDEQRKRLTIRNNIEVTQYDYSSGRFLLFKREPTNFAFIKESYSYVIDPSDNYAVELLEEKSIKIFNRITNDELAQARLPSRSSTFWQLMSYQPVQLMTYFIGILAGINLIHRRRIAGRPAGPYVLKFVLIGSSYVLARQLFIGHQNTLLKEHVEYLGLVLDYKLWQTQSALPDNRNILQQAFDCYFSVKKTLELVDELSAMFTILIRRSVKGVSPFTPFNSGYSAWKALRKRRNLQGLSVLSRIVFDETRQILIISLPGPYTDFIDYSGASFSIAVCFLNKVTRCSLLPDMHRHPIGILKLSVDGGWLCSVDFSGGVILWRWDLAKQSYLPHSDLINTDSYYPTQAVGFSLDERWLAVGGHKAAYIISIAQAKLVANLSSLNSGVAQLMFEKDAVVLATTRGGLSRWTLNFSDFRRGMLSIRQQWRTDTTLNLEDTELESVLQPSKATGFYVDAKHSSEADNLTWLSLSALVIAPISRLPWLMRIAQYFFIFAPFPLSEKLTFLSVPWVVFFLNDRSLLSLKIATALYLTGKYAELTNLYPYNPDRSDPPWDHLLVIAAVSGESAIIFTFTLLSLLYRGWQHLGADDLFDLGAVSTLSMLNHGILTPTQMIAFYPRYEGLPFLLKSIMKLLVISTKPLDEIRALHGQFTLGFGILFFSGYLGWILVKLFKDSSSIINYWNASILILTGIGMLFIYRRTPGLVRRRAPYLSHLATGLVGIAVLFIILAYFIKFSQATLLAHSLGLADNLSSIRRLANLLERPRLLSDSYLGSPATFFSVQVLDQQHPCYYYSGKTNIIKSSGAEPTQALLAQCEKPKPWNPYTLYLLEQSIRQGAFGLADGFSSGFSAELSVLSPSARTCMSMSCYLAIQYVRGFSLASILMFSGAQGAMSYVGLSKTLRFFLLLGAQLMYEALHKKVDLSERIQALLCLLLVGSLAEILGRKLGSVAGRGVDKVVRTRVTPSLFKAASNDATGSTAVPVAAPNIRL